MKNMIIFAILGTVIGWAACVGGQESGASPGPMKKYVTERASFVLYMPGNWKAEEAEQGKFKSLLVCDPSRLYSVVLFYGVSPTGRDVLGLARLLTGEIRKRFPDLTIVKVMTSRDRNRVVFDGVFTDAQRTRKEFRAWVSGGDGSFTSSSIEAPQGKLAGSRRVLLTILSNVQVMKGAFPGTSTRTKPPLPLAWHRLRDGSATFQIPSDWRYQDFGTGAFFARDPTGTASFIVGGAEFLTPRLNVRVPNIIVSNYLPPHQALRMVTATKGMAANMQFTDVIPRRDLDPQLRQTYNGPAMAEEFIYTFDANGQRCKGYSFGISFGSRLDTSWKLWHITVAAPVGRFDSLVSTFIPMVQSYTIDNQFARKYISDGIARLRQMQKDTAGIVSRNAQDIHQMMQSAYDERQKSMDYIDYQRTNYIRGQSDWISSMEGGTVYRSDSWGTRNTATGDYRGGQPYNYLNFTGQNPKYNEQMQEINSRALYEAYRK